MLFESLSWVILTLTLLVALPGALASPAPKKTKKSTSRRITPEIYPALENGDSAGILDDAEFTPGSQKVAKTTKSNRRVQTLGAPAPVAPPLSTPAAYVVNESAPATPARKFETVPAEKREQILARMRLCQSLFEVSGRAYDYRSMTTVQLQKELDAVRADERPVAAIKNAETVNPNQFVPVNSASTSEPDPILDAQE